LFNLFKNFFILINFIKEAANREKEVLEQDIADRRTQIAELQPRYNELLEEVYLSTKFFLFNFKIFKGKFSRIWNSDD
jgi:hypothetical protein